MQYAKPSFFVQHLIKSPPPTSCDTPSPWEKPRQAVAQGSEEGLLLSFIYVIVTSRCPRPFHYVEHYRTNRRQQHYLPQRADSPSVGQEIGGKMDKYQGELFK